MTVNLSDSNAKMPNALKGISRKINYSIKIHFNLNKLYVNNVILNY
jgi:hypothetical protein